MIKKIIQLINHRSSHVEKKAMPLLTPDTNVLQKVTEFVHYSEFKRILDKVVNVHTKDKVKSIAILSELPGEGKTLLCSSLAIGLSKLLNIKILIVNTQTYNAPNALTLDRALEIDDLHNPKNQPQKTLLVKTDILSINLQQNQPQQGIV
jgi:Mrp family chromosome partitioning ATPase